MAFYVAVLRWLIIYTLHSPSPCYSSSGKLMTRREHDGKSGHWTDIGIFQIGEEGRAALECNPDVPPMNQVSCESGLKDAA